MTYPLAAPVGPGIPFTGITTTGDKYREASYGRSFLKIVNTGANALLVTFSVPVTATNSFSIAAGATYEPQNVPNDAIYLAAATGTTSALIFAN